MTGGVEWAAAIVPPSVSRPSILDPIATRVNPPVTPLGGLSLPPSRLASGWAMDPYRLPYMSTSLIGADPELERYEIADILLTSRRHNETVGVTGALLATERNFAQVLEGELADVEDVYARIKRDWRHKDLILIVTERITERQFPQWSMAYIGPSQSAEEAVRRVASNVPASKPGEAARALVAFMSRMLAAAQAAAN